MRGARKLLENMKNKRVGGVMITHEIVDEQIAVGATNNHM